MSRRVLGLDELRAKVAAIPDAAHAAILKAMEEGAEEMVGMARRLVPVESGDLRESIGWTWGAAPRGAMILGTSRAAAGGDRITIFAGNEKAFYARFVEFGTVATPAQPYFFPSWRALRKRIKARNTRAVTRAIKGIAGNGN